MVSIPRLRLSRPFSMPVKQELSAVSYLTGVQHVLRHMMGFAS